MALKLECGYLKGFIGEHEYAAMASQVESAHALLASGKGVEEVEPLTAKLKTLSESSNVNICLLISADAEELPASVREFVAK